MKCVYVVRYAYRIDGEDCCGNFEFCHTDERKAVEAMLKDVEDTKKTWAGFGEKLGEKVEVKCKVEHGDNGLADYCSIWIENGSRDFHDWWIDRIGIDE